MSMRVRFFTAATDATRFEAVAEKGELSFNISATPEWNVSVLKSQINADLINAGGIAAEISIDGTLVIGGMCQRVPESDDASVVTVKGRQWIDTLYDEKAYSQAVYKNTALLIVLGELMRRRGWRLGDISTMVDKAAVTTIDLRSVEQLLPQITKAIEAAPDMYYRYGGYQAGKHMIDVGLFGTDSYTTLVSPTENPTLSKNVGIIEKSTREITQTNVIREMEMLGGDVQVSAAVTRAVNLGDALAIQPALATDPDFPIIVELASFIWKIRNNAIPSTVSVSTLKRLTQYAPEKTGTTIIAADIQNAGLALYKAGVTLLKKAGATTEKLSMDVAGPITMMPKLGQLVYVRCIYVNDVYDPLIETATQTTRKVEGYYRVNSIKLGYSGDQLNWNFDLTSGQIDLEGDDFVDLYNQTAQQPLPAGAVYVPTFTPAMATIAQTVSGGLSDTTLADGTPAKLFTVTLPGAPVGATGVYLAGLPYGTSTFGVIRIEIVSDPVFGGSGGTFKIAISDRWLPGFSASMETRIIWI